MSPITFKLFGPRGECRRVTYEDTPELATINELVDGMMVEGRRLLTYRDSEGDAVLLKTSRDVAEAVKDARDSGSQSIKVQIRLIRRDCPRRRSDGVSTNHNDSSSSNRSCHRRAGGPPRRADGVSTNHSDNSSSNRSCHRRAGGPPQWGRCWSRGLFGHPHHRVNWVNLEDEVNEVLRHFPFFAGIRVRTHDHHDDGAGEAAKKEAAGEPASGNEKQPSKDHHGDERSPVAEDEATKPAEETPSQEAAAKQVEKTPSPTAEPEATTPSASDKVVVAPTIEEATESQAAADSEAAGAGFTFVENEPEDDDETEEAAALEPKEPEAAVLATPNHAIIDEKLKLLKDMGFELPQDVARKMIKELNGRMDLIVRALVANQK